MSETFIKKHQPKRIEDAFLSPDIRKEINRIIRHGLDYHLTFWGIPGTGKTTLAHLIGQHQRNTAIDYYKYGLSDKEDAKINERVIGSVSGRTIFLQDRLFILDELDNLTERGLAKFNALLEDYDDHARFILILNDPTKITDKIKSRTRVLQIQHAAYDRKERKIEYYPEFPEEEYNKELERLFNRILDDEKVDPQDRDEIQARVFSEKPNQVQLRNFVRSIGIHILDVKDERLDQA